MFRRWFESRPQEGGGGGERTERGGLSSHTPWIHSSRGFGVYFLFRLTFDFNLLKLTRLLLEPPARSGKFLIKLSQALSRSF